MAAIRGSATRDIRTYRVPKARANHRSWPAKLSLWKGGKLGPCSPGGVAPVVSVTGVAIGVFRASDREQEQQRDEQGEDAERFRHREAEDQAGELPVGRGRGAQRAGEGVGEDQADADARAAHAEAGETGADVLRSNGIHQKSSSRGREGSERGKGSAGGTGSVAGVESIVEV